MPQTPIISIHLIVVLCRVIDCFSNKRVSCVSTFEDIGADLQKCFSSPLSVHIVFTFFRLNICHQSPSYFLLATRKENAVLYWYVFPLVIKCYSAGWRQADAIQFTDHRHTTPYILFTARNYVLQPLSASNISKQSQ